MCNGLVRPADESVLAQDDGADIWTTGHDENIMPPLQVTHRHKNTYESTLLFADFVVHLFCITIMMMMRRRGDDEDDGNKFRTDIIGIFSPIEEVWETLFITVGLSLCLSDEILKNLCMNFHWQSILGSGFFALCGC